MAIAEEIEEKAAVFCGALAVRGPKLLEAAEMDRIIGAFKQYGQRDAGDRTRILPPTTVPEAGLRS